MIYALEIEVVQFMEIVDAFKDEQLDDVFLSW